MKYLIFSTIGNDNFGDESMATNYINKNIGWDNLDLISYYEDVVREKYPSINAKNIFSNLIYKNKLKRILFMVSVILCPGISSKKINLQRHISEYDGFIMCGGGNLNNKYINTLIHIYLVSYLFKKNKKKVNFRPQSIGPFDGKKGFYCNILMKRILKLSDEFILRESVSYELAKKMCKDHFKLKLEVDDAWTLNIEEIDKDILINNKFKETIENDSKKIGISIRPWNKKDEYLNKISKVVTMALELGYEVYFIPIAYGGGKQYIDNSFIKEKYSNNSKVYFIEEQIVLKKSKSENIKWIISKMDKCIGLSYHFNVYSKALLKDTIALYSDKYYYIKNQGLYNLLKSKDCVYEIEQLNNSIIKEFLVR